MRYAIFADVHGNLEALEAILAALKTQQIDSYFCVGDIVGYGAEPSLCLAQLRKISCRCVAGNHDWAAVGKISVQFFNDLARAAILWTQGQLSVEEKEFLARTPLVFEGNGLTLVHGTLYQPQEFYYLDGLADAERTFQQMQQPLCFVGHNHVPAIIAQDKSGKIEFFSGAHAEMSKDRRLIVNVGSVGQPRDGNPQACCCIYDAKAGTIEILRISYPVTMAQEKILGAGLPSKLAYRLTTGS